MRDRANQINIYIEPEMKQELENACIILSKKTKIKTTKSDFVRQAIAEKIQIILKTSSADQLPAQII